MKEKKRKNSKDEKEKIKTRIRMNEVMEKISNDLKLANFTIYQSCDTAQMLLIHILLLSNNSDDQIKIYLDDIFKNYLFNKNIRNSEPQ